MGYGGYPTKWNHYINQSEHTNFSVIHYVIVIGQSGYMKLTVIATSLW